jgi:hypothetical protein
MTSRWLALPCSLTAFLACAEPAKVVSLVPTNGTVNVPVSLTNLVIEFDQDMRAGMSVTGGGPSFPKVTGQPRWETPRRLVVPVELKPGRDYRFGINSRSARNFRNLAGESTEPVVVTFRTGGQAGTALTNAVAMAEELRRVIREHYSYRDRLVPDWDARFAAAWPALTNAATDVAFADETVKLLSAANDPHLSVLAEDRRLGTSSLQLRSNADYRRLAKLVPEWREASRTVSTGKFPEGVGYLLIATWGGTDAELTPAHTALDFLKDARGLILDLRFNGGGDEAQARTIAGRFTATNVVYAQHRTRDPAEPGGWSPVRNRVLRAEPDAARRFPGKVAVLMGPRCMSSNEAFLLMVRAAGARLFGERSAGSSGNPKRFELGGGVTLSVPSWEAQDVDGTVLEGRGIEPHEVVVFDPAGANDAVLAAALRWLRQ